MEWLKLRSHSLGQIEYLSPFLDSSEKQLNAYIGAGAHTVHVQIVVSGSVTTSVSRFIPWKYVRRGICLGVGGVVVDVAVIYSWSNRTAPLFLFQM